MNRINFMTNVYEIYEIMFVCNVEANEFLFPYKYLIIIQMWLLFSFTRKILKFLNDLIHAKETISADLVKKIEIGNR